MAFKPSKRQMKKKAEMEAIQNQKPKIGTVFTCFPKLPAELRIRIWSEAASDSRIVKLRLNRDVGLRGRGWSSSARVPAVLQVNCEARQEGLKKYSLFFPLEQNGLIISPPRVYFNPWVDTLYLNMKSVETSRGPWMPDRQSLAEVQHLAIQTCAWTHAADNGYRYGNGQHLTLGALSSYQELKTLTLVRDFTLLNELKRKRTTTPIELRQHLTNEMNLLKKIKGKLDKMANHDTKCYNEVKERWKQDNANTPEPAMRHTVTPAVRVLEYQDVGVLCDNGAKRYDSEGKWIGYGKGKFVRLSKGWEWIVPEQWKDEEGNVSKDGMLALQRVGVWK